jgi:hypothetical protein
MFTRRWLLSLFALAPAAAIASKLPSAPKRELVGYFRNIPIYKLDAPFDMRIVVPPRLFAAAKAAGYDPRFMIEQQPMPTIKTGSPSPAPSSRNSPGQSSERA